MAAEPASVELGEYLGVIRRRYLAVGSAIVLCLLLGAIYGATRPALYRGTAQITLAEPEGFDTPASQQVDVQTELALVRSEAVAKRAADSLPGSPDSRTLLTKVSAMSPPDTRIMNVSFTADDPISARRGAQAFADAYILQKTEEQQSVIDTQVTSYQQQIDALKKGIEEQQQLLEVADPGSEEASSIQEIIDQDRNTLSEVVANQVDRASQPIDAGTIITPAREPREPLPSGLARILAASLAAGLLLGLVIAFVLDRLDTSVRGAEDLHHALGVRSLGTVPVFPDRHRRPGSALVIVHAPRGPEADAFRRLRTSVLLACRAEGVRTLGITSSVTDEGKTTVAANLAVALTQAGRRVLLVSADVRRGGVEELFDVPVAPGLTDVLLGTTTYNAVLHRIGDLVLVTRGTPVDNPTDLLGSETMARTLSDMAHGYDHVIVDTPPVLAVADVLVLAPMFDATLMVVSQAQATTAQVREAGSELALAGAKVLGAVLNNDAGTRRTAGAYAYGVR